MSDWMPLINEDLLTQVPEASYDRQQLFANFVNLWRGSILYDKEGRRHNPPQSLREWTGRTSIFSELIFIKNGDKDFINVNEYIGSQSNYNTEAFKEDEYDLDQHNKFVSPVNLYSPTTRLRYDTALRRIYSRGSHEKGGRFYGRFNSYVGAPKAVRASLLINGEPTTEPDFACHHPNMLFLLEGKTPPKDFYNCGMDRNLAKLGFNTAVNMNSEQLQGLELSLARNLAREEWKKENPGRDVIKSNVKIKEQHLIDARTAHKALLKLQDMYPEVASYVGTGKGLELQKTDSDIVREILKQSRAVDIKVFPVHDSIICKATEIDTVKSIMIKAYQKVLETDWIPTIKG